VPGIWTSLTVHHYSISWPIDRVFRIPLVISWRPELTALLTALPRTAMLVLIVGIAQAKALMLHLAPPAPSKREKRGITTNPLLTTRRFDQRRVGIATETTMLAGYWFGFQAVVWHGLSLGVGLGLSCRECAHQVHRTAHCSILSDHGQFNLPPSHALSPWGCVRERRR
jgi:hypothetical protein